MIRCAPYLNFEALGTVSLASLEPFLDTMLEKQLLGMFFRAMTEMGLINDSNLDFWARKLHQRVRNTDGT